MSFKNVSQKVFLGSNVGQFAIWLLEFILSVKLAPSGQLVVFHTTRHLASASEK